MKLSTILKKFTHNSHSSLTYMAWDFTGTMLVNLFVFILLIVYLSPLAYMFVASLKLPAQFADPAAPLYPADAVSYTYEGKKLQVYIVPTPEGERHLALVKAGRSSSDFVDPQNPEAGLIKWEGNWR